MITTFHYTSVGVNIIYSMGSIARLKVSGISMFINQSLIFHTAFFKMIRIKIKLDVPESPMSYFRLQEQWENEGGTTDIKSRDELVPDHKIPFTPGDYLRIVNGNIDLINDDIYYIADVEIVEDKVLK